MPTITEKIPTITESDTENIGDEFLSLGEKIHRQDENAYISLLVRLAESLSPEAKHNLTRKLRSPLNSFGIFKDDPGWLEIEKIMEQNRERDH